MLCNDASFGHASTRRLISSSEIGLAREMGGAEVTVSMLE
jgi:hypothetical protein